MLDTVALTATIGSSVVALLSAIIAMTKAAKVSRIQAETALAQERESRSWQEAKAEAEPIVTALDGLWQHLQFIKEEITKVAAPNNHGRDISLREIENQSSFVIEGYAKHGSKLSKEPERAWHRAKGLCSALIDFLREEVGKPRSALDPSSLDFLRDLREVLSDVQQIITRERQQLFEKSFRHFKGIANEAPRDSFRQ